MLEQNNTIFKDTDLRPIQEGGAHISLPRLLSVARNAFSNFNGVIGSGLSNIASVSLQGLTSNGVIDQEYSALT